MTAEDDLKTLQKAMRRISRALDLHSRRIDRAVGLTLPQLVVLALVRDMGEVTGRSISAAADLSPPTVVGILDKLEAKGLIERYRSAGDRRIVHTRLTEAGRAALFRAPSPIGEDFARAFARLPATRRTEILGAFDTVANLFDETTPVSLRAP